MLRYPYSVYLKTADGWLAGAALLYGAFALISGFAFVKDGGRYALISGVDGRVIGFLFISAAVGYFARLEWRANTSWKAKITMRASFLAFCAVLTTYLWKAFTS